MKPRRRARIPTDKSISYKEKFIVSLRRWGLKSKALEESDITLRTLKKWLEEDEVFAREFDDIAEEQELSVKDELETVALKRAITHSDGLLKFLLGKLDPTYRDRAEIEHKGQVNIIYKENLDLKEL